MLKKKRDRCALATLLQVAVTTEITGITLASWHPPETSSLFWVVGNLDGCCRDPT